MIVQQKKQLLVQLKNQKRHYAKIIEQLTDNTTAKARFTDSTLLRAMETAGNDIDDEEVLQLMKNKGLVLLLQGQKRLRI